MSEKIMFTKDLGAEIKKRRKALGLKRGYVAIEARLDFVFYDMIERGKRSISLKTFTKIAKALDMHLVDYEAYVRRDNNG